jgi:hypothetical protein
MPRSFLGEMPHAQGFSQTFRTQKTCDYLHKSGMLLQGAGVAAKPPAHSFSLHTVGRKARQLGTVVVLGII